MGRTPAGRPPLALASLALLVGLLASGAGETPRPAEELPPPGAGARTDTLFLFAAEGPGSPGSPGTDARGFTFDGPAGEAAPAGWHGVDLTDEGVHWQLASTAICAGTGTDMSPAQPFDPGDTHNDFALWCGGDDPCWADPLGYGNDWDQLVVIDLTGHPVTDSVRLDLAYRSDFEGGDYDYFSVAVKVWVTPIRWDGVFFNHTGSDRTFRELSVSIPALEFDDMAERPQVALRFTSDGGWSDEDGSYLSDVGAVWIDNLRVSVDGEEVLATDFEDGIVPARLSLIAYPAAGDFAQLYQGLYQGNADPVNESFVWACFDSLTSAYEAPGYEFGIVRGPPYVDNAIESPPLAVDGSGAPLALGPATRVLLRADIYWDLSISDLIFVAWEIGARLTGQPCPGSFHSNNTVYYGELQDWTTSTWDVTDYLWESAGGQFWHIDAVTARLRVVDMYGEWGFGYWEERNQAPYFDNIRLMLVEGDLTAAPAVPAANLALSAQPNPFNPATELRFSAPADAPVRLDIFDLAGRRVATLFEGPATGGEQRATWIGRDGRGNPLPAGVYLARLKTADEFSALKLLLLK